MQDGHKKHLRRDNGPDEWNRCRRLGHVVGYESGRSERHTYKVALFSHGRPILILPEDILWRLLPQQKLTTIS